MTQIVHEVILTSGQPHGKRLPPHAIGVFLAELPQAIRRAVSMRMRNRSLQTGKRPAWLERSADIRFVDMQAGETSTLTFERLKPFSRSSDTGLQNVLHSLGFVIAENKVCSILWHIRKSATRVTK